MKKKSYLGRGLPAVLLAATSFYPIWSNAGYTAKIDDTKWVSLGAGLRTTFRAEENAAPNGSDYSKDFDLESIRLYLNGQVQKYIKFEFNTEKDNGDVRVLDGVAKFEFNDLFNIWGGRMLPPSDRSNLDGPYYLGTFDFPFVSAYPAIFAGRDNGAAVWGQTGGGVFKYQFGTYEGCKHGAPCATGSNRSDNLLYAGRLTYNFWDPEPGYYTSSDYFGAKDVLALAVASQYQQDATGTATDRGNFLGWNTDALMQKKLAGGGVVSLEGAYYDYNLDDKSNPALIQGQAYLLLASYLFPQKLGFGQVQPVARYQNFDADNAANHERWDLGFNYIIDGQKAKISVMYYRDKFSGEDATNNFLLGVQLQI
jgi:hypothetical protein